MSHLTHVKNVFTRKDLLLESLSRFGHVTIEEPGRVRFYGQKSVKADIVAKLKNYDLGFIRQPLTPVESLRMQDESEDSYEFVSAVSAYTPVCDFWNGEVEAEFGKNLCELNAIYYSLLLCESVDNISQTTIKNTDDKILITIEI
jgi:hypothetical protein